MSEGTHTQPLQLTISRNTIFWIVSGAALALYLLAVPLGLYGLCSAPEQYKETIPGHISIHDQQIELHGNSPQRPPVRNPIVGKTIPAQQAIEHTAEATYYPPREPVGVWWRTAVCTVGLSDYLIGLFTLILAISTIGLWWQTERLARGADDQSEKMEKSIAASMRSASAAERAAEASERNVAAMVGAERPIVWPSALINVGDPTDKQNWLKNCRPKLTVKNCGRTTVIVTEVIANIQVGKIPAERPAPVQYDPYPEEIVIEAGQEHTFIDYSAREHLMLRDIEAFVTDPTGKLHIFGEVRYRDFSGPHTQGWLFIWVAATNKFATFHQQTAYYRQT